MPYDNHEHYFVVEIYENELEERFVYHSQFCPQELVSSEEGAPFNKLFRWICPLGQYVDYWGFIDLEDDERYNVAGEYKIGFYWYNPPSTFEDSDAYLFFIDEKENDETTTTKT